jgi:hypothetical protein
MPCMRVTRNNNNNKAEARVQSRDGPYRIYGDKVALDRLFSKASLRPVSYQSTNAPHSSLITGWYNIPIVDHSTKRLSLTALK